jgi:hypothetical protein
VHLNSGKFHQFIQSELDGKCCFRKFVLQSARVKFSTEFRGESLVFLRFKTLILFTLTLALGVSIASAQATTTVKPSPSPTPVAPIDINKGGAVTPAQVAESVIFLYSGFGGRENFNQIRKTTFERGRMTIVNNEGATEKATYERFVLRADTLDKERIRLDQAFPASRYSLVYSSDKIFGIFNDQVFTPRDDVTKSFEHQIWHGLEALLRYKENGATLELDGKEKIMGVEFYRLDVTDKQNRKTRFFVSTKSFRVMHLEYTEGGIKYQRKFYDYNYAQGTLFPFRTVLWAGDKQIEETEVLTVSYGLKLDESMFQGSLP